MRSPIISVLCTAVLLLGLVSVSEATLVGRLPVTPGGFDFQAIYDADRDITWLQDANLAASNTFGLSTGVSLGTHPSDSSGVNGVINTDGSANFPGALFWIDAMNEANHLGFNDWRLPTTLVPDLSCAPGTQRPTAFGCTGSDMGHLYYTELSNNIGGDPVVNTGPFSIITASYWSGTEIVSEPERRFFFTFSNGRQGEIDNSFNLLFWAVRDGDVATVPIPSAMLLFATGLVALVGWNYRKRRS